MIRLLRKPFGSHGKVHEITPSSAGWRYVGFSLWRLRVGETVFEATGDREVILVMVEGKARLAAAGRDWGVVGERINVFEKTPPHCLYLPNGAEWKAVAETDCVIAACSAPGKGGHEARRIGPEGITLTERGKGTNTRNIHNIAMENEDFCDSLLVTKVFTPAGHWSSYPSHRDDSPRITYLEETYYHRLNPGDGFGIQRVYTDDGTLDETMAVRDGDVVLVPRGHHPCGAPYGFEMYYLNVMAGPLRKWRFVPESHVGGDAVMDFALNQKTAPKLDFAAFLDLAAELGCVEPRNDLGRPIFDGIELVRAGEMAHERGLRFIGLSEVYPFNDWNDNRRAAVALLIETAQAAGAETVSLIPRVDGREGDDGERATTLRSVLPMLHGTGVVGLVKPIGFSKAIESPDADDRLGIVHDTFRHHRSAYSAGSHLGHSGRFRHPHRLARRAAGPCRRKRPDRHLGPGEEPSRGRLHRVLLLRVCVSARSKHRRPQGTDRRVNHLPAALLEPR
jgi:5-deoxy-glucuronate isomerase